MDRYLLDTTGLIDVSRRYEPVVSALQALVDAGNELGVSPVSVAEFFSGIRVDERPRGETFLDTLATWDLTRAIATQAGNYRRESARSGRTISPPDALIAATALTFLATLLTNNVRHFGLPGLRVERLGR